MAYAQQTAFRVQETEIHVPDDAWVVMEASAGFPGSKGEVTPLARRFAIKIYNVAGEDTSRLGLSYDNTIPLVDAKQWLGTAGLMVEPVGPGLILYGRGKPETAGRTVRVMVTEYGH